MNRKEQLLKFLESSPDDAFLNYALAQEYISEGNDTDAEKLFNRLIEIHPTYSATYYHLGKLLERRLQTEEAKGVYRTGIETAKQNGEQHAVAELQSALLELEYD